MTDRESPIKRYELEALAAEFKRDREQAATDRKLDREQAAKDSAEIKALLKENNDIMRTAIGDLRKEVTENYVTNPKLALDLQVLAARLATLENAKKTQGAWLKAAGGTILALLINQLWTLFTNQQRLP